MTDDLTIPDFLLVKNRKPLSPELAARLSEHRVDTSIERWRELEASRKQERRERAREAAAARQDRREIEAQIAKHRAKHPDPVERRLRRLGILKDRSGK